MIDVDTIKKETSDMDFGIHKENLSDARSLSLREILNRVSANVNIYVEDETKRKYSAGDWDDILGLAEADVSGVLIDDDSPVGVANKNVVSIISE